MATTKTRMQIDCFFIDFNGQRFGCVRHRFGIAPFEGKRDIISLPVYPARFMKDSETILRRLTEMGERFIGSTKTSHMHFNGRTQIYSPTGVRLETSDKKLHPEDVDSQARILRILLCFKRFAANIQSGSKNGRT